MAKVETPAGTTSYLTRIFLQDSSSTTGAGLTGLTSGSSGLVCYRARDDDGNAGGTAISLSGGTKGTWSSGGFVEKDATNMPGIYEFGVPDAALAAGSKSVLIMFKGATNLAPLPLEIQLGINVNVVAIDGQNTNGNNATLNLKQLNIVNSAGDAVVASSTGSNGHGINASGNGSGDGVKATGGTTGHGVEGVGGATSGHGIKGLGTNNGAGILAAGNGTAPGLWATAGVTGHGILASGGATSGDGMRVGAGGGGNGLRLDGVGSGNDGIRSAGGTNGHGIEAIGVLAGDGIKAISGSTGNGIEAVGGSSSGDGFNVSAAGSGLDINANNSDIGGVSLSTAGIAAIWNALTSGMTTVGSIGKLIVRVLNQGWRQP